MEALRCCVNRGRPFGDPNWVTDTAERLELNGRFGLVEDRRNNHKACHSYLYSPDLVAVTLRTLPSHPVTLRTPPFTRCRGRVFYDDATRRIGSDRVGRRSYRTNADGSISFGPGLSRLGPHEPIFRAETGWRTMNRWRLSRVRGARQWVCSMRNLT